MEQIDYRCRQIPETVQELILHIFQLILRLDGRYPLVKLQLLHFVSDIGRWKKGIDVQIQCRVKISIL